MKMAEKIVYTQDMSYGEDVAMDKRMNSEDPAGDRPAWQHPELVFLGKLGDLVQGHGKTSPNDDMDPNNTAKQGVG
jgi:hypothetical protein